MDRDTLRAAQAPIKENYRQHPETSLMTLHAGGDLGDGVSCSVQTGRGLVEAGLHSATGGSGLQACSGDMLLEALAACAGVTLSAVATSLGIPVSSGSVRIEGDLDFSGTLGVSSSAPVGFTDIRVSFDLVSSASEDEIATLCRLTERYCVIFQTLAKPPSLDFAINQERP